MKYDKQAICKGKVSCNNLMHLGTNNVTFLKGWRPGFNKVAERINYSPLEIKCHGWFSVFKRKTMTLNPQRATCDSDIDWF